MRREKSKSGGPLQAADRATMAKKATTNMSSLFDRRALVPSIQVPLEALRFQRQRQSREGLYALEVPSGTIGGLASVGGGGGELLSGASWQRKRHFEMAQELLLCIADLKSRGDGDIAKMCIEIAMEEAACAVKCSPTREMTGYSLALRDLCDVLSIVMAPHRRRYWESVVEAADRYITARYNINRPGVVVNSYRGTEAFFADETNFDV